MRCARPRSPPLRDLPGGGALVSGPARPQASGRRAVAGGSPRFSMGLRSGAGVDSAPEAAYFPAASEPRQDPTPRFVSSFRRGCLSSAPVSSPLRNGITGSCCLCTPGNRGSGGFRTRVDLGRRDRPKRMQEDRSRRAPSSGQAAPSGQVAPEVACALRADRADPDEGRARDAKGARLPRYGAARADESD